jgi:DNA (cytosine-5)-methyltransferase 1
MGYHQAGFDVVGVDIEPRPNYPFDFVRADALTLDESFINGFDAIHASPPCQRFTAYRRRGAGVGESYLDLIEPTRDMLNATGLPYVIENVEGAPLREPARYCGSSFGLDVRRHRCFESNVFLLSPPCDHGAQAKGRFPSSTGRKKNSRATVEVGVWRIPLETQKKAMGVDWPIELRELSEAIPPAYTRHIGAQLISHLKRGR